MATRIAEFHARANLDASGFDDGAAQMSNAMNRAARDVDNAWGIITNTSIKSAQASANVFKKSGLGDIRPVEVYSEAVGRASVETKKLWASQIQAKVAANALRDSLGGVSGGGASGAVANLTNAQRLGGRASARFGVLMQQAGYQVQDFSVQVAGGQNKLVAFSQQASQMLGFFGPGGAIAGAVLAVGVLAARVLDTGDAAAKSTGKVNSYIDAWKRARELEREIREAGLSPLQRQQELQEKAAKAAAEEADAAKRLVGVRAQLDKMAPVNRQTGSRDYPLAGRGEVRGLEKREELIEGQRQQAENRRLEAEKEIAAIVREQNQERLEGVRASVAAEGESRRVAWQSFAEARKANALAEMNTEQQLDYFVKHLDFLDEIGARNTEEYEKTKARTRELGSILLGQSGEGNWKLGEEMEKRAKQILGLQQRMPESLRITTGANALGGSAGTLTATQTLDIQKRILSAIERLVQLEVAGQN